MPPEKPAGKEKAGLLPRCYYASHDLYEDANGGYFVDYAQYETSGSVRVWPVETYIGADGREHIAPSRGQRGPLMSLMTRADVREKMPMLLKALLDHIA